MSFVTTVTCARNIKDDYPSFFYIRGDFASEHVARVSDNGDRMRGRIKTEVNTLAKAKPLGRCLASGVPAMDCSWENLYQQPLLSIVSSMAKTFPLASP